MSLTKPILLEKELKYVGKSTLRFEDLRLTSGEGGFMDDLPVHANLHYVSIVRSPYAHAKILKIDTSEALKEPGVRAVLTPQDYKKIVDPLPLVIRSPIKYYPFAIEKARYVGEPVAVVVAKDRFVAEDAAAKVEVDYEPLPVVIDSKRSLERGAPVLHEDLGTNLVWSKKFQFGDPERAFEEADHVIGVEVKIGGYTVPPLEPFGVMAAFEKSSGILTEWCNFIGPFTLFYIITRALKLSEDKFRVIIPKDNGGSFGTKLAIYPYMALIGATSMLTGLPVKWIETRSENFIASTRAATRNSRFELAVSRDGTFIGLRVNVIDDVGAYPRSPEPGHLLKALSNIVGPYKIKHVAIDAKYVVTNTVPTSPIRAFGRPHLCVPLEKLVAKAAKELHLDPVELRLRNFILPDEFPYRTPTGGLYDSGNYAGSMGKLMKLMSIDSLHHEINEARSIGRNVGLGVAVGIEPSVSNMAYLDVALSKEERGSKSFLPHSGAQHSASVKMEPSGSVTVQVDSCPQGQGHETVAAQIVSSLLGVKPEDVRVITGVDTHKDPWSVATGTYASRFGSVGISAIYTAGMKVRGKLVRAASKLLDVPERDLDVGEGFVFARVSPSKSVSIKRIAGSIHWNPIGVLPGEQDQNLFASSTFNVQTLGPATPNEEVNSSATYGLVATAVLVEVSKETGETKILKYASVHDPGNAINPAIIKQLCEGGANQGVAHALFQELCYNEDGQPVSTNFGDYYVPTSENTIFPMFDSEPCRSPFTPLGTKGVSEGDNMTAPAAILIAIEDACSITVDEVPATPEKIWRKIHHFSSSPKLSLSP
ncbi:MAG: xanthine dehydrogenase family protein molybdopterin-binding subunit [Nitrososphaerales archaeon]